MTAEFLHHLTGAGFSREPGTRRRACRHVPVTNRRRTLPADMPARDIAVRGSRFAPWLGVALAGLSTAVPALLGCSLCTCSSKRRRTSSIFIFSISAAYGAETAVKRRRPNRARDTRRHCRRPADAPMCCDAIRSTGCARLRRASGGKRRSRLPHQPQWASAPTPREGVGNSAIFTVETGRLDRRTLLSEALELTLDKSCRLAFRQLQPLADAFVIGDSHNVLARSGSGSAISAAALHRGEIDSKHAHRFVSLFFVFRAFSLAAECA